MRPTRIRDLVMKRILLAVFLVAGIMSFAQTNSSEIAYMSNGSAFVYEKHQTKKAPALSDEVAVSEKKTTKTSGRPFIKGVRFNGYFDMNLMVGGDKFWFIREVCFSQSLNFSLGARIYDYGYVGLLSGVEFQECWFDEGDGLEYDGWEWMIPIMVDMRGYYPINEKYHPYAELALGCAPAFYKSNYDLTYFKIRFGVGIDINRLSLGLGLDAMTNEGMGPKQFYVKVGYKIGKKQ